MILHNFIVFEGIDGAGTSTQINLLKEKLPAKKTMFTAEPTEESTGKFLRSVLKGEVKLHPATTAFLFAADRNEHLFSTNGIVAHCKDGGIAVTDRYLFSSLAYQSISCGKELPQILNQSFPLPEYLFFFDIEPSISLNRIRGRNVTEIYEKQDFLEKTAKAYRQIIKDFENQQKRDGMKIFWIDATKSIKEVEQNIWSVLKKMPILQK
ncbi:MAG: dTMP kinase [Spirochaetaceae bacterium]|nr:dTMP kinase [Spirochaetaceae bacterium]